METWDTETITDDPEISVPANKWMSNGVYFPCFGLLVGPLFGTEIFPLPPKQEKYHFNLVMGRPTDHYDGNPNGKYEIEIRNFMDKYLKSFIRTSTSFQLFDDLDMNKHKWTEKFPFSSVRWGQKVTAAAQSPTQKPFTPIERNPNLFNQAYDQLPRYTGKALVKTTGASTHTPIPPIKSKETLIDRQQQLEVKKIKDFLGSSDKGQSPIFQSYERYTEIVQHFRKNGGQFKAPQRILRKVLNLTRDVLTVNDMEKWILQNQSKSDFNAYHDGWTNRKLLEQHLSHTDKARLSTLMLTFLEYNHFMEIRTQVRTFFYNITDFVDTIYD